MENLIIAEEAICLACGTNLENSVTGFCKNGHDDWLEEYDDAERFEVAQNNFKLTISEILNKIRTSSSLEKNVLGGANITA